MEGQQKAAAAASLGDHGKAEGKIGDVEAEGLKEGELKNEEEKAKGRRGERGRGKERQNKQRRGKRIGGAGGG